MLTQADSIRINVMKLVCAMMVVAIHIEWPWEKPWSVSWVANQVLVYRGFTRIAVPFFFLCSGFFLAKHLGSSKDWGLAVRKRVRTLVVPFFLWTFVGWFLLPLTASVVACVLDGRALGLSVQNFLCDFDWLYFLENCIWRADQQLWFLRCLFVFVLLAPAISFLLAKFKAKWLVACLVMAILYHLLPWRLATRFFYHDFCLPGLFYFSCGIYLYERRNFRLPILGGGGHFVLSFLA